MPFAAQTFAPSGKAIAAAKAMKKNRMKWCVNVARVDSRRMGKEKNANGKGREHAECGEKVNGWQSGVHSSGE